MTSDTRVTMHRGAAALFAVALLIAGAGITYLLMRRDAGPGAHIADTASSAGAAGLDSCAGCREQHTAT